MGEINLTGGTCPQAEIDTYIARGTQLYGREPDAIDILPGLMPSMLRKVRQMTGLPILTGGLITEKKEVMQALEAGALAISSTAPAVWEM